MEAYPTELQDIRDHLVLRGFLEGINHSQVRLDLRKQIGDKDMSFETVLERALHLEAVTRIEEEEQTTKVAVIRRDETKDLVEAVTRLVNQLSVDDKQRENRRNQRFILLLSWSTYEKLGKPGIVQTYTKRV